MTNIDLRLLSVISELQRTRSVSQCAENLGLSQSAISMALAKLRKHFHDPLFVRTSAGMELTPYAEQIVGDLKTAGDLLQAVLEHRSAFDPATSDRRFHLCSTDIAQFTILPPLMAHLRTVAPEVTLDLANITDQTPRLLESGQADLAIGLLPQMGAGFCQQKLADGRFVCAVCTEHPRIKTRLTLEAFQRETHLVVTTTGTGYHRLEKTLEVLGIRRNVGARVPSFLGVAGLITVTDYLAIVPERLGKLLARGKNMRLLPLPFEVPPYSVTQVWHERYSLDPGHQWLRTVMVGLFSERPQPVRPARDKS